MEGWRRLLNLPDNSSRVLAGLIHRQARPSATGIALSLRPFHVVPLLGVARVAETQVFLDLATLIRQRFACFEVPLLRVPDRICHGAQMSTRARVVSPQSVAG